MPNEASPVVPFACHANEENTRLVGEMSKRLLKERDDDQTDERSVVAEEEIYSV